MYRVRNKILIKNPRFIQELFLSKHRQLERGVKWFVRARSDLLGLHAHLEIRDELFHFHGAVCICDEKFIAHVHPVVLIRLIIRDMSHADIESRNRRSPRGLPDDDHEQKHPHEKCYDFPR